MEFYFWLATRIGKGFLLGKGNAVSKDIYKGIDFCGFFAACFGKECVSNVLKNWFVVSEKSANF